MLSELNDNTTQEYNRYDPILDINDESTIAGLAEAYPTSYYYKEITLKDTEGKITGYEYIQVKRSVENSDKDAETILGQVAARKRSKSGAVYTLLLVNFESGVRAQLVKDGAIAQPDYIASRKIVKKFEDSRGIGF